MSIMNSAGEEIEGANDNKVLTKSTVVHSVSLATASPNTEYMLVLAFNGLGSSAQARALIGRATATFTGASPLLGGMANKRIHIGYGSLHDNLIDAPAIRHHEGSPFSRFIFCTSATQMAVEMNSTLYGYTIYLDGAAILTTADLDDGVHPTDLGHQKVADYLKTIIGNDTVDNGN
jgi:hypothetical protein